MNDLPENELFSAYLDGELSTAERAEMERLLADSPAARQLLDQLRAISSAIHNLPPEKLGEDLSRQVVHLSEQRRKMGTGSEPPGVNLDNMVSGEVPVPIFPEGELGDVESASVPLARSVFRRFLSRRTLVWLAITAAVVVMIKIDEWRQGGRPGFDNRREVALAPAEPEMRAKESHPLPSIQPAEDRDIPALRSAGALCKKDSKAITKTPAPAAMVKSMPASAEDKENRDLSKNKVPQMGYFNRAAGETGKIALTQQLANAGQNALVVRCNITPEAVKRQAFDKLLLSNGIAPQQQKRAQTDLAFGGKLSRAAEKSQDAIAADEEDIIFVEAAPEQIGATLKGLKTQPNLFHAISVRPAEDKMSQDLFRQYSVAPAGTKPPPQSMAKPLQSLKQAEPQLSPSQPALRQQVLFVLRVTCGDRPPPAAAKAGVKADVYTGKPAAPAQPPPAGQHAQ